MYTEKLRTVFESTTPVVLTSNAVIKKFTALREFNLRRVAVGITTQTSSSGGTVLTISRYPTMGASTSAVVLATITVPSAVVVGSVYYKDLLTAVKILPGQELVFEVTTAATSAGACLCMFDADDSPETAANVSAMTASA